MAGSIWPVDALAQPPATQGSWQVDAGLAYGQELERGGLNRWGLGAGIGAGHTLRRVLPALYAGARFDYFFGSQLNAPDYRIRRNYWEVLAEVGYDWGVARQWVVRPKLSAGVARLDSDFCQPSGADCAGDSSTGTALAPGASFMYLTQSVRFSFTARYDVIFAEDAAFTDALVGVVGFGL